MRPTQAYLALYNAAQAVGWACCLASLALGTLRGESPAQLYSSVVPLTKLVLGASLLETAHAAVGLVPSSPLFTFMLWAGRSNVFFLIVQPIPQLHASWWSVILLACWAKAEVIRYPQYALSVLGACPGWLTWLRYTMFIPLFPAGVVAEMALMLAALPTLAASGRLSLALPNRLNWAFSYHRFIQIVLACYPLLWWQLYSSLLRARSKKLGGGGGSRAPKGAKAQ